MDSLKSGPTQQDVGQQPASYWRYTDVRYAAPLDKYDNPIGRGSIEVRCHEMRVLRLTPKGAWVEDFFGKPRFVRRDARKQYALPTKEEALASFIARKKAQRRIYSARLEDAEEAIALAQANRTRGPILRFCFDRDGEALL